MFKTIVLATDGSPQAERAGQVAADLARHDGAKLVLAHVDERMVAKGDMPPVHPDEDQIKHDIEAKAEQLSADGVEASVQLESVTLGGPGPKILEIADEVDADLVVTGTRGRSSLTGLLLGSVAHKLVHISKRPVLVVPSSD